MAIRIDWGELGMALDSGDGMTRWLLDRDTGELIGLCEWDEMEEEEEIRAAIDAGEDGRYLEVPSRSSHEGFRAMEDFARSLDDDRIRERLFDALDRRRPFRAFKDALEAFPEVRERWFEFEEESLRRYALEWLQSEGIEAELVPFVDRSAG
jgi:hypothetical protein